MIIAFKEFANKFKGSATVYIGKFRWEDEDENPKRREFSQIAVCKDVDTFSHLCLSPNYQLDVYTDVTKVECKVDINTESHDLDFAADRIYIVAPSFGGDLRAAYARKNRYSVEKRVLTLASKELTDWIKGNYDLQKKVKVALVEGPRWTYDYIPAIERTNDSKECDKKARHALSQAKSAFRRWLKYRNITETEYFDYLAQQKAEEKKQAKIEAALEKRIKKEHNYINDHLFVFNYQGERVVNCGYKSLLINHLNVGKNTGDFDACISKKNGVICDEEYDHNGYSKSCHFTMVRRSFTLNLKKGYNIYVVGGLITFVRGKLNRSGMACEWVEQGKSIADIHTVKGYLVRGEHIVASSLKAAQRISRECRNKKALNLLNVRAKKAINKKKLSDHMFTFEESLAAGNCRPGTQNFKNRYEAAIGHEANEISLSDLRKYGKEFGLKSYTERVINYVMSKL